MTTLARGRAFEQLDTLITDCYRPPHGQYCCAIIRKYLSHTSLSCVNVHVCVFVVSAFMPPPAGRAASSVSAALIAIPSVVVIIINILSVRVYVQ